MRSLLIRNGRVIDPSTGEDAVRDLWIVNGLVADGDSHPDHASERLDADGLLVMPGFVDIHVHLREPGNESAETLASGCAAALAGGFTSIVAMPNTTPPLDSPAIVREVLARANGLAGPRVYAMVAVTRGRQGNNLTDIEALAAVPGVVGFTDDGNGVEDDSICRAALERLAAVRLPLAEHCEVRRLSRGASLHPDYPPEAETTMVERDIRLADETGARVHLQHLSAARSVEIVRRARKRGVPVSAEVTPHHLALTCEDALRGGADFKMNPPLRTEADRRSLIAGLADGTIDCVASDHAPHTPESKSRPLTEAPFGVIGLETAAAVVWTWLIAEGHQPERMLPMWMSTAPSRVIGIAGGTLAPGSRGDVTLFDPTVRWVPDPSRFRSLSRNCPFAGRTLTGRVAATVVAGEVRYRGDFR